jgi:hypothetical protein
MPAGKLLPFDTSFVGFATMKPKDPKLPTISGHGSHDWQCAKCSFVVVQGFDHVHYRIGDGVALVCGRCGFANEMPKTGIPAGDPAKQITIEVGRPQT